MSKFLIAMNNLNILKNLKQGILFFIISLSATSYTNAQKHLEIGMEYGFSAYFGDLVPYSTAPSAALNSNSFGYYLGAGNKYGTIFVNYTTTEIFGADREATNEGRKRRNLDFRSPIQEYGTTLEISPMGIFRKKHSALQPLLIAGFNIFKFNPKTLYNGEWIDLQPLGTEGQGSAFYPDRPKYNLTQISIPLGLGLKYELNNNVYVGCGFKVRITFTDYLDDVSTEYVDQGILESTNGPLAAELAFRTDEIDNTAVYQAGRVRGNPNENDWYMTTYLSIGIRFREDPTKPPKNRVRKHKTNCFRF